MSEEYRVVAGDDGMYVLNTASWRTFRPVIDSEMQTVRHLSQILPGEFREKDRRKNMDRLQLL